MSCTIEKALANAKALVERLRNHDDEAESLIEQTTALSKRVETMKQYQEEIQELNEVARHRPRPDHTHVPSSAPPPPPSPHPCRCQAFGYGEPTVPAAQYHPDLSR
ncbi:putative FGFR1 oncogene partner 2 isoform 1 [Cricetulus griseus]|uniref:Putative FGFR1 oncogene partner 2 isoform 1 n=1 Tax=Cricetulus griseus TaxID=10029 RepID=A0A061IJ88_CRIGR|nr:putative FGFR1 oncogene partner 2 isoform 1 [Cricetulus griseus]